MSLHNSMTMGFIRSIIDENLVLHPMIPNCLQCNTLFCMGMVRCTFPFCALKKYVCFLSNILISGSSASATSTISNLTRFQWVKVSPLGCYLLRWYGLETFTEDTPNQLDHKIGHRLISNAIRQPDCMLSCHVRVLEWIHTP